MLINKRSIINTRELLRKIPTNLTITLTKINHETPAVRLVITRILKIIP